MTPKKKRAYRNDFSKDEKTWRQKGFVKSWLEIDCFKGWLSKVPDDKRKAKCKACNKELIAGKSDLMKHAQSVLHISNVERRKNMPDLAKFGFNFTSSVPQETVDAELRYAILTAEKNISFNTMESVIEVGQTIVSDSSRAKQIKLKATMLQSIILDVLGNHFSDKIRNEAKDQIFSLLIDESTDVSTTKILCILIKFVHNGTLKTFLLDLREMSADGATGTNLFNSVKDLLKKNGLNFSNMVGFCSDNASSMMGRSNGVAAHLLKQNDSIFIFGCICHSEHLIASAAGDLLPKNIEGLMHNLFSYFSRSPKRQCILNEIQEGMKSDKFKMINPSRTRWLALENSVKRILNQWKVLQSTFLLSAVEDKTSVGQIILSDLNNPFTKAYFCFLNHVLPIFNNFNKLFQSDKLLLPVLYEECRRMFRLLCGNFIKECELSENNLVNIDVYNLKNLLDIDNIL